MRNVNWSELLKACEPGEISLPISHALIAPTLFLLNLQNFHLHINIAIAITVAFSISVRVWQSGLGCAGAGIGKKSKVMDFSTNASEQAKQSESSRVAHQITCLEYTMNMNMKYQCQRWSGRAEENAGRMRNCKVKFHFMGLYTRSIFHRIGIQDTDSVKVCKRQTQSIK